MPIDEPPRLRSRSLSGRRTSADTREYKTGVVRRPGHRRTSMRREHIRHYEILERIGAGGMGEVYLARDTRLDRRVALKFLPSHLASDEKARERFLREARAASRISHPHILTIHEVGEDDDGNVFIAMQYIDGRPLSELIRSGDLNLPRAIAIAMQICEGLARAHESGVIHRDIKPDNILIDADGNATILDFGLARLIDGSALTRSGTMIGTMQYMSPEQARGEEVDGRSDLFSVGAVLYEMITGQSPFKGENPASVINKILNEPVEPPSRVCQGCPAGIDTIIERALAKDTSARYESARAMYTDLQAALSGVALQASPWPLSHPNRDYAPPRYRGLTVSALAMAVPVLVLLTFLVTPLRVHLTGGVDQAVAGEGGLAIMYFDNLAEPADSSRLSQIVTSLLITDLAETRELNVVSRQRLNDLVHNVSSNTTGQSSAALASTIADRTGAKWLLSGSILRTEPTVTIIADITDVATRGIIASERIEGGADEDVFDVVDRLGQTIRRELLPDSATITNPDKSLAEMTTDSPDAYRAYLRGQDLASQLNYVDAVEAFEEAIDLDSTFAAAYFRLAQMQRALQLYSRSTHAIKMAKRYIHRAGHLDSLYIESFVALNGNDVMSAVRILDQIIEQYPHEKDAMFLAGITHQTHHNIERAIPYLQRVISLDSSFKLAYNNLAYAYHAIGRYDKAIEAINRYIALAPGEFNPYDSRGELHAMNGNVDAAIESYQQALAINPDFHHSIGNLGHLYVFAGQMERADSLYKVLFTSEYPEMRSRGRRYLAYIPLYHGHLRRALAVLRTGLLADSLERAGSFQLAQKYMLCADIFRALGHTDS
ncbi:MAG: protein kinase, partial [candidate division Zixibacteria bacterium]|nr:protein kinase [candidate division Zixibacteria bacterium]